MTTTAPILCIYFAQIAVPAQICGQPATLMLPDGSWPSCGQHGEDTSVYVPLLERVARSGPSTFDWDGVDASMDTYLGNAGPLARAAMDEENDWRHWEPTQSLFEALGIETNEK